MTANRARRDRRDHRCEICGAWSSESPVGSQWWEIAPMQRGSGAEADMAYLCQGCYANLMRAVGIFKARRGRA